MGKKKVFEKIDKCGKLASFNDNIPGMENEGEDLIEVSHNVIHVKK